MLRPETLLHSTSRQHSALEDLQGIASGVLLITVGVAVFAHLGIATGGIAGFALVVSYATGWNVGLVFFLANLPFLALAVLRLGPAFSLKTIAAIASMSLLTGFLPKIMVFSFIDPLFGAVLAGVMVGYGMLALFRHRASIGGVGILAFYLQERFGWRAGYVQLSIDAVILFAALFVIGPAGFALSLLSAAIMNLFVAINHRRDRYLAG